MASPCAAGSSTGCRTMGTSRGLAPAVGPSGDRPLSIRAKRREPYALPYRYPKSASASSLFSRLRLRVLGLRCGPKQPLVTVEVVVGGLADPNVFVSHGFGSFAAVRGCSDSGRPHPSSWQLFRWPVS